MNEQEVVKYQVPLISLVLAVVTFVAYEQVRLNDFVIYDDEPYVTDNPNVNRGLSGKSIAWAFTSGHAGNWHPLTWLSHMADCQVYGLEPTGHHITNLLLHILNTLLLFGVFKKMTARLWPSAFVAAIFAVHPLHVESVAWASERKDVLSTLFWLLTMIAYVRYAERSGLGRYLFVALLFGLGLMAKPMLVTLPIILLLLDYWPLRRFDKSSIRRLVVEKFPLFMLAAGSSVITFLVQNKGGAVAQLEFISLTTRIGNALLSYVGYIGKMIYPSGLAVLYPFPLEGVGLWRPLLSAALLAGLTVFFVRLAGQRRYLLVGWLWYLATLVPVIGIVQVGIQAMADRYTYIPSIGFFMIVAWGLGDLLNRWKHKRVVLIASALIVIVLATLGTRKQVMHWRNSITLFEHTLNVTEGNYLIHNNYGRALGLDGRLYEALHHCQKAAILKPDFAFAHYNLGVTVAAMGNFEQAIDHYQQALRINPDHAVAHNNLGMAFWNLGKIEQAIDHYQQALRINPDYAVAHYNLGLALTNIGKREQAIDHYQQALRINPDHAGAHNNLGNIFVDLGSLGQAIDHYKKALSMRPDDNNIQNKLAWILATVEDEKLRDPAEAVRLANRACELTQYAQPYYLDTLAVAYAANGDFPRAIETAEKALRLAVDSETLSREIRERLELYEENRPYAEK